MEFKIKQILLDLIYKVDNGANILLGNSALADDYTNKIVEAVENLKK